MQTFLSFALDGPFPQNHLTATGYSVDDYVAGPLEDWVDGAIRLDGKRVLRLKGGESEAFRMLDALRLFKLAVSLGGTESLASHPSSTTHSDYSPEAKARHLAASGGVAMVGAYLPPIQSLEIPKRPPSIQIVDLSGTLHGMPQGPVPIEGNLVKREWLPSYDSPPQAGPGGRAGKAARWAAARMATSRSGSGRSSRPPSTSSPTATGCWAGSSP